MRGERKVEVMLHPVKIVLAVSIWTASTATAVLGTGPIRTDTLKFVDNVGREGDHRTSVRHAQGFAGSAARNAWTDTGWEEHATP